MALRDNLRERVAPFLAPGEQIQQVFICQAGANPWVAGMFGLLGQSFVKRRIVAVTTHGVLVLGATFNGTKPTGIINRLPVGTRIGPVSIWAPINLGGEKNWSTPGSTRDIAGPDGAVALADAAEGGAVRSDAPAPGPYRLPGRARPALAPPRGWPPLRGRTLRSPRASRLSDPPAGPVTGHGGRPAGLRLVTSPARTGPTWFRCCSRRCAGAPPQRARVNSLLMRAGAWMPSPSWRWRSRSPSTRTSTPVASDLGSIRCVGWPTGSRPARALPRRPRG
jgi:hypothetical protein